MLQDVLENLKCRLDLNSNISVDAAGVSVKQKMFAEDNISVVWVTPNPVSSVSAIVCSKVAVMSEHIISASGSQSESRCSGLERPDCYSR